MDTKAILNTKKKVNELAIQHNKLTTLVACLLNEIQSLRRELSERDGVTSSSTSDNRYSQQTTQNAYSNMQQNQTIRSSNNLRGGNQNNTGKQNVFNFNELRAEEILQQLAVNHSDN